MWMTFSIFAATTLNPSCGKGYYCIHSKTYSSLLNMCTQPPPHYLHIAPSSQGNDKLHIAPTSQGKDKLTEPKNGFSQTLLKCLNKGKLPREGRGHSVSFQGVRGGDFGICRLLIVVITVFHFTLYGYNELICMIGYELDQVSWV